MYCIWLALPFYVIEEGLAESHFGFDIKPYYNLVNCSYKKEIFRIYTFSEQLAAKGNSPEATHKYSHLFICISVSISDIK